VKREGGEGGQRRGPLILEIFGLRFERKKKNIWKNGGRGRSTKKRDIAGTKWQKKSVLRGTVWTNIRGMGGKRTAKIKKKRGGATRKKMDKKGEAVLLELVCLKSRTR